MMYTSVTNSPQYRLSGKCKHIFVVMLELFIIDSKRSSSWQMWLMLFSFEIAPPNGLKWFKDYILDKFISKI